MNFTLNTLLVVSLIIMVSTFLRIPYV